ncbi:vasotab isoform X2 [Drosophila persimilis]|uniref:vasotab isoform X2 n=1 Tax=Drosophila persimilis TaxID=7234 RepID=UPI000F07D5F4|nr:vasotab isoform X2 [Drosophila persimilis]
MPEAMKSFFLLLGLLLTCSLLEVQSADLCPTVCPAIYNPVCGETRINGRLVRCQFSNSCVMGVSGCVNSLNWCATDLRNCRVNPDICKRLGGTGPTVT